MILVFGATGALGGHVLAGLVQRGIPPELITAAGRNRGRLDELAAAGFGFAAIDLGDTGQVAELVARHRDIVLISGSDPDRLAQHLSVISAAKRAGVAHLYYTSGLRVDDDRFPINADHKATEDALTASGVTYTILRNTWYIENYLQSLDGPRHTGILAAATGDTVVAAATRKDLGEALAVVLTTDGHDNLIYHLNGDSNYTYTDIAHAMTESPAVVGCSSGLRARLVFVGRDQANAGMQPAAVVPVDPRRGRELDVGDRGPCVEDRGADAPVL